MSHQAVTWAMEYAPMLLTEKGKPDTTARHVLQVLAEYAHADGSEARPAVMRLQYRTGYDRRTVQRALRRLEDGGLIRAEGTRNDCTVYRLALHVIRPESDWKALEAEEERQRGADAERQRRSRARRVTHANDVTVTDGESVTGPDVTDADSVSHALSVPTSRTQNPDVTDGTPPDPSFEPSGESSLSSSASSDRPEPAAVPVEREIDPLIQKLMTDHDASEEEATTVVAQVRREGTIRSLAAWARSKAGQLDFKQRLAEHRRAASGRQLGPPGIPPWCERCGDDNPAARFNPRFRVTPSGECCPACHPDAASAA